MHQQNLKDKNYKLNVGGTDQRDLERAMKESMDMYNKQQKDEEDEDDQKKMEEEEQNKFKAFQGQGISMQSQSNTNEDQEINQYFTQFENSDDPELAFVLKMSLNSKFENRPSQGIVLQFRFPDGTKKDWTFTTTQTIRYIYDVLLNNKDLYDYAKSLQQENKEYKFKLTQNFPKVVFQKLDISLEQAGLQNMTAIIVTKI